MYSNDDDDLDYGYGADSSGSAPYGADYASALDTEIPEVPFPDAFVPGEVIPLEPFFNRSTGVAEWREQVIQSRSALEGSFLNPQGRTFADIQAAGLARPSGADAFELRLRARFVVPRASPAARPPWPLAVIVMGNHPVFDFPTPGSAERRSHEGYRYLQQALAEAGIASLSVDTNTSNMVGAGIRQRADTILRALELLRTRLPGLPAEQRVDLSRIGLVGHSRGGEAVVYATLLNRLRVGTPFNIQAVFTISQTDFSADTTAATRHVFAPGASDFAPVIAAPIPGVVVPFTLTPAHGVRHAGIHGSHDGDIVGTPVRPPRPGRPAGFPISSNDATAFTMYDRFTCSKKLSFIRGATHNRFNTVWNECALTADGDHVFVLPENCTVLSRFCRPDPTMLKDRQHREFAIFYVRALMRRVLLGDLSQEPILQGKRSPDHPISVQWALESQLLVDELNPTVPPPPRNALGGARALAPPGAASVVDMATIIGSPHRTLAFQATTAGATIRLEIPAGANRNVSARRELTFRLTSERQISSPFAVDRSRPADWVVHLETAAAAPPHAVTRVTLGPAALLRTGALERNPPFFHEARRAGNVTKRAFDTLVIPLATFQSRGANLNDVRAVILEARPTGSLPLFADSFAFV